MSKFKIFSIALLASAAVSQAQDLDQARKAIDAEQYEKAKSLLKSIIQTKSNGRASFLLGNIYLTQNIEDSARISFDRGLSSEEGKINNIGLGQLELNSGNVAAAKALAKNTSNPVANMIEKGIMRIGKPIDAIEKSMENVGKLEMYSMERNLNILSLVSGIAPMFGFLGTIIGMVQLFYGISSTGEYTLNTIAGGIYTKMITSATGLIIGLIAYVGHNFLSTQIDKTANKMERASADFLDILQEPTQA